MSLLDTWEGDCAAALEEWDCPVFGLFSGGHDSLCSTHIASTHPRFQAAVHINTGTGIAATTRFVRETCEAQGWPLIEMRPDAKTYDELVMEKGFPSGPASHAAMFYWLKQRQIRRLVKEQKGSGRAVGLVAGVRRKESDRRMAQGISEPVRRDGAQLWLNPILLWDGRDKNRYMEAHALPRNEVVDVLHKSGECLCGAFARRGELAEIALWYPEEAEKIRALERRAKAAGLDDHLWGMRSRVSAQQEQLVDLPLCQDCEVRA